MIKATNNGIHGSFVHLHTHSEYSLLDGAARVRDLVRKAVAENMPALAITDHGVMYAVIEFYKEAVKCGIKPIIGFEAYVAKQSRLDRTARLEDSMYHLTLLASSQEGYRNLVQLCSRGHMEGFYYKPRIDRELLERYHEGLIVLSGCISGEIPVLILEGKLKEAEAAALYFRELLGKDNYYLEIQDHGIAEEKLINRELVSISRRTGIPLVATNDIHYIEKEDAFSQDVMLCIQTGKTINDDNRMRFPSAEFYFKTEPEMRRLFGEVPEALSNTVAIAEKCFMDFRFDQFYLPEFEVPAGETSQSYLRKIVYEQVPRRLSGYDNDQKVLERIDYELDVINRMGFADYFLIVHDLVNWAKRQGIAVGPGRGSAAGSLVSYLLSITALNPLEYGLLFERFLNPERVSMPDIDIDFCFEKRDQVIKYIVERYGHERVSQIITFGTMAARAAIRDVGRALDYPYAEVDKVAKMVPGELGVTLDKSLEISFDLRSLYESDYQVKRLLDSARALEGMPRHASVHAAGVVIGPEELINILPLQKTQDGNVVTQFTKETVEEIGLLKMDILGLRTLTVIQRTLEILKHTRGLELDLEQLPLDDPAVYQLLSSGETIGVFQLESEGFRRLLAEMRPNRFEDLIAIIGLYRPGPLGSGMVEDFINRKHGRQEITYPDPRLEPILAETYGVILYQEQVMQIAGQLAGFTMGQADGLRRAMGKKKPQEIKAQRDRFITGAVANGVNEDVAAHIFDLMEHFAGYGFNKSHSAAYAMISYQTAFLKAHYPVEFMCAFLTSVIDNQDRVVFYINECKRLGIKILPPDINESYEVFTVVGDKIRFGLGAIKNVGETAIKAIISARKKNPFQDLYDFCRRVDLHHVNKRVLENLIQAGCFDSTGIKRKEALSVMDTTLELVAQIKSSENSNQLSLFGAEINETEPPRPLFKGEFAPAELLAREKEVLGLYVSGNPLDEYREILPYFSGNKIADLSRLKDGSDVKLAALVNGIRRKVNRKGEAWASMFLEDLTGKIEALLFAGVYRDHADQLTVEGAYYIEGRLINQEEDLKVVIRRIGPLPSIIHAVHIRVKANSGLQGQVTGIMAQHPGPIPVYIHLPGKTIEVNSNLWVKVTPELKRQLEEVCGPENVWFD